VKQRLPVILPPVKTQAYMPLTVTDIGNQPFVGCTDNNVNCVAFDELIVNIDNEFDPGLTANK
jgi:hypothetical protein